MKGRKLLRHAIFGADFVLGLGAHNEYSDKDCIALTCFVKTYSNYCT